MKKISVFLSLLFVAMLMIGCSSQQNDTADVPTETGTADVAETPEATPIYADQIADGSYEITVDSSASMFKVVACTLVVENGTMNATMTMSGQGYGKLYMGTGEKALQAEESEYIPFVEDENGAKTFTVPVEALNKDTDCAAWSIKKEQWYDRVLAFESDSIPEEALTME